MVAPIGTAALEGSAPASKNRTRKSLAIWRTVALVGFGIVPSFANFGHSFACRIRYALAKVRTSFGSARPRSSLVRRRRFLVVVDFVSVLATIDGCSVIGACDDPSVTAGRFAAVPIWLSSSGLSWSGGLLDGRPSPRAFDRVDITNLWGRHVVVATRRWPAWSSNRKCFQLAENAMTAGGLTAAGRAYFVLRYRPFSTNCKTASPLNQRTFGESRKTKPIPLISFTKVQWRSPRFAISSNSVICCERYWRRDLSICQVTKGQSSVFRDYWKSFLVIVKHLRMQLIMWCDWITLSKGSHWPHSIAIARARVMGNRGELHEIRTSRQSRKD